MARLVVDADTITYILQRRPTVVARLAAAVRENSEVYLCAVEDRVLDGFRAIARRRGITLAEVTREALSAYVSKHAGGRKSLSIIGIGRSGRGDVAERAEELLREGLGHFAQGGQVTPR
jgi:hypothetical protein